MLPGRRLRGAAAARGARRSRAWLGEPALLAAAGLAWRRAGPARDPAWRRRHRGDHVPDRGRPGHRAGVRSGHRADPARATPRRPARPAVGRVARRCWSRRWTASPTARWCRAAARRRGLARAKITVADAGVDWNAPGAGVSTGWSVPAPRHPAHGRHSAASASSSARCARGATERAAPGQLAAGASRVSRSAPPSDEVELGFVQPPGRRPMPAPDWARGARRRSNALVRRRPGRQPDGAPPPA